MQRGLVHRAAGLQRRAQQGAAHRGAHQAPPLLGMEAFPAGLCLGLGTSLQARPDLSLQAPALVLRRQLALQSWSQGLQAAPEGCSPRLTLCMRYSRLRRGGVACLVLLGRLGQ